MNRIDGWPEALADFIESRRFTPFSWGANDCCLFACDAALAITGTDIAAAYRGTYDSALSAARVVEAGGGIDGIMDTLLPRVDPAFAQRGDLVIVDGQHGPTLAVCLGAVIAATGEDGLAFFPANAATAAWKV